MAEYSPSINVQDEVLAFLLTSPTPEQIIAFHPSVEAQNRMSYLLEANRNGTLTPDERAELDESSQLNHLFMRLKAKAHQALKKA